jgi:predicted transcriptional regulator
MKREDLLNSPYWWLAHIQSELYGMMEDYRVKNKLKKKDIAKMLGFSKGYISQVLKGDCDHKLSKMIELSLAFGKVPKFEFVDVQDYIKEDSTVVSSCNKNITVNIVMHANDYVSENTIEKIKEQFNESALISLSPNSQN